jgi:hypothetical protein
VHYIPLRGDMFGHGFEALLINGVLGFAGLALIVPLFIPSRWRSPRPVYTGTSVLGGAAGDPDQEQTQTISLLGNDEYPPVVP